MTDALPGTTPRYKTLCTPGRTPRRLAAKHKRQIETIRKSLDAIDADWGDLVGGTTLVVDDIRGGLDELETEIKNNVEYLEEALPE